MIKGIVLTQLAKIIMQIVSDTKITNIIISNCYHDLFIKFHNQIWISRCKSIIEKKLQNNINSYAKKNYKGKSNPYKHNMNRNTTMGNRWE